MTKKAERPVHGHKHAVDAEHLDAIAALTPTQRAHYVGWLIALFEARASLGGIDAQEKTRPPP